ncbi:MAG TPA: DegV family protein [Tissierellaceae bacterium]|nr:DegV family protein [Tissierellaceae bacterium]
MSKIKIVTDSTSYISKDYIEKEDVAVVPLNYVFDGETYLEGFKGEFDDFFRKLENSNLFPTTSQPSVGDFHQVFKDALKEYDEIIAIVLSSKLSGTYNSAVLAKDMLEDERVTIIDSETSASNLRFLVEDAVEMAKANKSSEEIIKHINNKKNSMKVFLTAATLEYLKRGGRLSALQSTIGNLLNIKPIIELKDGQLQLLEKVRGKNRATSKIISYIHENVEKISICHILNLEEAEKFKSTLEEKFPKASITIDDLGPVVGSHLGPKAIGICFY